MTAIKDSHPQFIVYFDGKRQSTVGGWWVLELWEDQDPYYRRVCLAESEVDAHRIAARMSGVVR